MGRLGILLVSHTLPSFNIMFYTLSQLQKAINNKIEEQGPDAPVAAWIFSQYDVVKYDYHEETNETIEKVFPMNFVESVLMEVADSDYIYEVIGEIIDDEINEQIKNPRV